MAQRVVVRVQRATMRIQLGSVPSMTAPSSSGASLVAVERAHAEGAGEAVANTVLGASARVFLVVLTGDLDAPVSLGWSDEPEALIESGVIPENGVRFLCDVAPTGTRRLVLTVSGTPTSGSARALIQHGIPES